MIAGFLAGFAERLVPDLLNSYTIAGRTPPEPLTAVAPGLDKALAAEGGEPPVPESEEELDPPPSDEEHLDGCEVKLEPRRLFAHRTPIPAVPDRPTLPPFEVRQSDVGFQAIGE